MVFKPIVSYFLSSKLSAICSDFSHRSLQEAFKPSASVALLTARALVTALAEEARLILLVIASARTVKANVIQSASTAKTVDFSLLHTPPK